MLTGLLYCTSIISQINWHKNFFLIRAKVGPFWHVPHYINPNPVKTIHIKLIHRGINADTSICPRFGSRVIGEQGWWVILSVLFLDQQEQFSFDNHERGAELREVVPIFKTEMFEILCWQVEYCMKRRCITFLVLVVLLCVFQSPGWWFQHSQFVARSTLLKPGN